MLFNSYTFFIFLFVILVLYYSTKGWTTRKIILLLGSYVFYMAWNPPFVLLLILSTIIDWAASNKIFHSNNKAAKKYWLLLSLISNFGLLAFFKYGNFIIENLNLFVFTANRISNYDIILPVGISFYTFQTVSYTIDIYRGNEKPAPGFLDFALYVTFFPQLVAGPIVRSGEFLQQCEEEKKFNWDNFGYGFFWLTTGLFLKVVVADYFLAPVVEALYVTNGKVDMFSAWSGVFAFSGQILCDFSGYSICAIGAAKMLGFYLPKNFKFPYASAGFSEFWRRWHISLSSWLRDYLYIPMGGNKKGELRTYQNLMATMLVGGLWHGASWTFVAWGGLHGFYLSVERLLKGRMEFSRVPLALRILGVYILVCFAWIFFRAKNFPQAGNIIGSMLGWVHGPIAISTKEGLKVFSVTLIILVISFIFKDVDLEERVRRMKPVVVSVILAFFLYLMFTLPGEDRSFIYFQF